ncbi:hypothetical protein AYI70_g3628 [Smittium culicis]|uniref:Uncharacterized protein n=1 Tax=Smittium culicis TaxID=133412 RepID=A0A1R1Y338_9FUNG|nr:hypothetical protein AYI70_g3628 [Smittium culicis]
MLAMMSESEDNEAPILEMTELQLQSKESISDNLEELRSEDELDTDQERSKESKEYSDSHDESVHLMYAGIENEIYERVIPKVEENKGKQLFLTKDNN